MLAFLIILIISFPLAAMENPQQPNLIDLIQEEKFEEALAAINAGADLTCTDINGNTPLHYACMRDQPMVYNHHGSQARIPLSDIFDALLEHNANPNAKNYAGQTPLFYTQNLNHVRACLRAGADSTLKDCNGEDAFMHSFEYDNSELSFYSGLLGIANLDPIAFDRQGYTLLHRVCRLDVHASVIYDLLQRGANPNAISRNERKTTPLHLAAHSATKNKRMSAIFSLLVSWGADSSIRDGNGDTPFDICMVHAPRAERLLRHAGSNDVGGDNDLAGRFLLETSGNRLTQAKKQALFVACEHLAKEFVELLLEHNTDIPTSKYSRNPLHALAQAKIACSESNLYAGKQEYYERIKEEVRAIAVLLIERGAQLNGRNNFRGDTPFERDAQSNRHNNIRGATPLLLAVANDNPFALEIFLELGADLTLCTSSDHPLNLAKSPAVISLLMKAGLDPNWQNKDGQTALHKHKENAKIVATLLAHGADPNAQDYEGNTPLHFINSLEPLKHLLQAGARIDIQNKMKMTPWESSEIMRNMWRQEFKSSLKVLSLDRVKNMVESGAWVAYKASFILEILVEASRLSLLQTDPLKIMLTHPLPGAHKENKQLMQARQSWLAFICAYNRSIRSTGISMPRDVRIMIRNRMFPPVEQIIEEVPVKELHSYQLVYGRVPLLNTLINHHMQRIQTLSEELNTYRNSFFSFRGNAEVVAVMNLDYLKQLVEQSYEQVLQSK